MTKPKISDFFRVEFIKFLFCNGFAAVVNFLSRIGFNQFLGYAVSVVLAYLVGMVTAFILNKIFVFNRSELNTGRQFFGFVIVNAFAVLQTLLFSLLFRNIIFPAVKFSFHPDEIAHLIGISIPIFTSFLGHKHFSFQQADSEENAE